jgi:voltage-dependent calcium channel
MPYPSNTGVVVENFSYVFQVTGGAKSITREEMRAFKKVWAELANQKTGFLERNNFVPFFGVCLVISFCCDVEIYPSIPEIKRHLRSQNLSSRV